MAAHDAWRRMAHGGAWCMAHEGAWRMVHGGAWRMAAHGAWRRITHGGVRRMAMPGAWRIKAHGGVWRMAARRPPHGGSRADAMCDGRLRTHTVFGIVGPIVNHFGIRGWIWRDLSEPVMMVWLNPILD